MGVFNKFTPEEDYLILREYWDPSRRQSVAEAMADRHTAKSVQFRYFQLLKLLNLGSATVYKRMMSAHEEQGFQLPFDIEELVQKLHSGELKAEKEKQEKAKAEKEEKGFFKRIEESAKKEERAPEPPARKQEPTPQAKPMEEEFVDPLVPILDRIQASIQDLYQKVEQISAAGSDKALIDLFTFLANAAQHKEQIKNLEAILEENKRLKEENEQLRQKYQEKAKEFEDIYQRLDEVWGHFMRLTSVKKAMSLEDFIDQLRFVIDRFGNVVDVTTREAGLRAAYRKASEAALR